jgi:hypothetical protein
MKTVQRKARNTRSKFTLRGESLQFVDFDVLDLAALMLLKPVPND